MKRPKPRWHMQGRERVPLKMGGAEKLGGTIVGGADLGGERDSLSLTG